MAGILGIFGFANLTEAFTGALKKIDWLYFFNTEQKAYVAGLMAEVAALTVAALVTWIAASWLTPLAEYVDSVGLWTIVLAVWGFARGIYRKNKTQGATG